MKKIIEKIFSFIVRFRTFFLAGWGVLLAVSVFLINSVQINYDSTQYLPKDSRTKEALEIMESEFGLKGQAILMIEDVSINEAVNYKKQLSNIEGVESIIWLDSFIDSDTLEQIRNTFSGTIDFEDILGSIPGINVFYRDGSALFQIMFEHDDHSLKTGAAITAIKKYLESTGARSKYALGGSAVSSYYMREMTKGEVVKITLYVVPIVLLILLIFTNSWMEPVLFLVVVGVAVLVNMGTNVVFPNISFITNSTAALLQLAISMDYAIFLLHQYTSERKEGKEKTVAMADALKKSVLSISSSMLTTVAGFAALFFMRYSIGTDLSGVMIKGIIISLLATFTLLPAVILLFDKLLEKTKHRRFFPSLAGLNKIILKLRYVIPAVALIVLVPMFQAQNNNHFVYGEAAMSTSEGTEGAEHLARIEAKFGKQNMMAILVPNTSETEITNQKALIRTLEQKLKPYRPVIQSYATITDIGTYVDALGGFDFIPQSIIQDLLSDVIPPEFQAQLESENYSRIIVTIQTDTESEAAFAAVKIIEEETLLAFGNSGYVIGVTSSVSDIKQTVNEDFVYVNILSIVFVLVILIVSFRSLSLPVILVFTIQLSVWINMSIPYFFNEPLIFIGFVIVGAIQLGATIDYGILLTQHYLNGRKFMQKNEALKYALDNSGHSVLTSGLILTAAGFALKLVSSIQGISSMGELIGRGAALSIFLVLVLLPQLLYRLDSFIQKTTYKLDLLPAFDEERPPGLFDQINTNDDEKMLP